MKNVIIVLSVIGLVIVGCKSSEKRAGCESGRVSDACAVRVGVYDSRVIAFAYWSQEVDGVKRMNHPDHRSDEGAYAYWAAKVDGKARYEPPKDERLKGKEFGYMMHQQVFSYHEPVQALEYIAGKLPELMEEAGVDVIVCKWENEKLTKYEGAKLVDITDRLVRLYEPTEEFLKGAKGFDKSPPMPLETNWLEVEE